ASVAAAVGRVRVAATGDGRQQRRAGPDGQRRRARGRSAGRRRCHGDLRWLRSVAEDGRRAKGEGRKKLGEVKERAPARGDSGKSPAHAQGTMGGSQKPPKQKAEQQSALPVQAP